MRFVFTNVDIFNFHFVTATHDRMTFFQVAVLCYSWLVDTHSIPGAINLLFSSSSSDRLNELFALSRLIDVGTFIVKIGH